MSRTETVYIELNPTTNNRKAGKMEKVINAVQDVSLNHARPSLQIDALAPGGKMLEAAKEFSAASIDSFSGELLDKAMKLVIALADFAHELNGKE